MLSLRRAQRSGGQSGFSLVEGLLATSIVGVVGAALMSLGTDVQRYRAYLKYQADRQALRQSLVAGVSCEKTLEPFVVPATGRVGACAANFELRDLQGAVIASAQPSLGGHRYFANCVPGLGVEVRVRMENAKGQLRPHPLDGKPLDETHPDLNPLIAPTLAPSLCPEKFTINPRVLEVSLDMDSGEAPVRAAFAASGATQEDCRIANINYQRPTSGPESYLAASRGSMTRLDRACYAYCSEPMRMRYKTGSWLDCDDSNTKVITCMCVR